MRNILKNDFFLFTVDLSFRFMNNRPEEAIGFILYVGIFLEEVRSVNGPKNSAKVYSALESQSKKREFSFMANGGWFKDDSTFSHN